MKKVSHQQLAQWLEQARRGDERAFRALYDATAPAQYSQALAVVKDPELAREAVQDSYLSFYRSMGRIQSSQAVVAYLNKTTHYASLALLRREKRPPEEDTDLFALPDAPENGPEEQVLTADRRHRLQAALAELSPRQRQAVQLRYYQRQKLDQVAHSMQCSRSTVQRLLRDAHAALRRSLGGGLLAVLPLGAVLRSAQKPPLSPPWRQKVAAAAVASTVLLTAAVWSAQSPTIRTTRVLAQYPANTAAVEVSLSGRTADSLTLVGPQGRRQPFVRRRDGRYRSKSSHPPPHRAGARHCCPPAHSGLPRWGRHPAHRRRSRYRHRLVHSIGEQLCRPALPPRICRRWHRHRPLCAAAGPIHSTSRR